MIRELGRGNFVVYQARDDRDGRVVAIKVARPDDPGGRWRLMSLAHEAEKIKALEHPRVVKLYEYVPPGEPGVGVDGYIVLEYVEGRDGEGTLEELLRAGPVPVVRLIRIVALVAETLHHAHTHATHVVHRDVKPSNILLDPRVSRGSATSAWRSTRRSSGCTRARSRGRRPTWLPSRSGERPTGSTAAPTSGPWASSSTGG